WLGAVAPAWSWFQDNASLLEQRRTLLLHMRAVVETLPALRDAAEAGRTRSDSSAKAFMPGASDVVAAADLQESLQKIALSARVGISAIETQPVKVMPMVPPDQSRVRDKAGPGELWHKVALRITLKAPWPALIGFLRSVEQLPTRVFVDDLHVHYDAVGPQPALSPVQASMLVYGFRALPAGPGT
ncbi:MAG TPA: type II secretion system protein GspM, partial [Rhodopila sp.]|nr:type II secretion system protein GspM [Rhodopila sp.]